MKKIISIICVMAMVLSFAAFSVNAADNEVSLVLKSQDADSAVISVMMNTTYTVSAVSLYIDAAAAVAAGATVAAAPVAANKGQYNSSQKMVLVTYTPTDGSTITGEVELATITLTNITSAFELIKKAEGSRTPFKIGAKDPNGGADLGVQGEFDVTGLTLEVAPFVDEPVVPEVETVEMAAPAFMTEATASEEAAGWQVGQGVALKFTVADLAEFVAMNWKLTCANIGTKYAKVADEDFTAIKASSADTIDVFASFIVNSKDAKETVNAITAVGAGFKKADGTVVETK